MFKTSTHHVKTGLLSTLLHHLTPTLVPLAPSSHVHTSHVSFTHPPFPFPKVNAVTSFNATQTTIYINTLVFIFFRPQKYQLHLFFFYYYHEIIFDPNWFVRFTSGSFLICTDIPESFSSRQIFRREE